MVLRSIDCSPDPDSLTDVISLACSSNVHLARSMLVRSEWFSNGCFGQGI